MTPLVQAVAAPAMGASAPLAQVVQSVAAPLVNVAAPLGRPAGARAGRPRSHDRGGALVHRLLVRPPSSAVTAPAAASSLDRRQAEATAATFAQPLASPQATSAPTPAARRDASTTPTASRSAGGAARQRPPAERPRRVGRAGRRPPGRRCARHGPAGSATDGLGGGGAQRTPTPPPCNSGAGPAGAGANAGSGSAAALPAAAFGCSAPHGLRTLRLTPTVWRQAAFVSLQERPG